MPEEKISWKHVLFVLLIVFILRLPAFWTPILDVDEAQFAGFAHSLLSGGIPYIDSVDTKPLGIYFFFAAVFKIFGVNNLIAVHIATALWAALTAYFCLRIAKRLYSPRAGLISALFYAVFTTTYIPKFISTSIVVIMMLPLTMSIDALLMWESSKKARYLLISGFLWGTACLFKYQAGINLFVAALYLLFFKPLYLEKSLRKTGVLPFLIFTAGGAIAALIFVSYLVAAGAWDAFVFWSLKGSMAYVEAASSLTSFWMNLAVRGGAIAASAFVLWYFGIWQSGHLITRFFKSSRTNAVKCEEYLVLIWFLLSIIPVCTGGKFYGHYFLQLYPALSILAAGSAMRFFSWLDSPGKIRLKQMAYSLFIAGLLVPSIGFFGARLYADKIYSAIGEENPKNYIPIAKYIKTNTNENDRIFVWGFATPIYIYSNRLGASRFLWCDWLTGRVSGTPSARDEFFDTTPYITKGSWQLFFQDMNKNKPLYFIDTSPGNYHDYGKYPITKYPDLMDFLETYYHFETSVNGANIYRRNKT
jgi:4-amino-4-deoxy-L-arabinose transferase-like glycosyltransferase